MIDIVYDLTDVPPLLAQKMSTRRYGMREPMISNDMHKQTPLRGLAPLDPTALGVIRIPNPNYGSSASTQPQYMEFIPTPEFPKH
ncbi:hypothetical protein MTR_4g105040 [Medicago truncatula]|uniref:Uncharacterized protein n=1 Tax=Medicago truncatula TaxID=3880 RepID=A0A072UR11_MEDTR|nr:hypothetical protein MTR_4g105040 [Medicago truncatula]